MNDGKSFSLPLLMAGLIAGLVICQSSRAGTPVETASVASELERQVMHVLEKKAARLASTLPRSRWSVSVKAPGSAARLSPCETDLTFEDNKPDASGKQRIRVNCQGPRRWSLYMSGKIVLTVPVLVASASLESGSRISSAQVSLLRRDIAGLRRGYLTSARSLAGKTLRRRVRAGTVLTPAMLTAALVVRKGDRVLIRSGSGGISVAMPGTALENGAEGERIRARNLGSGKTVYGRAATGPVVIVGQ